MKHWTTTKTTVAGVLAACLLCCATAEAKKGGNGGGGGGGREAAYTIVPFIHPGYVSTKSAVSDLNEVGQAVGFVELANGNLLAAHLDLATGVYTTLSGGGPSATAAGVNDLNQIVGNDGDYGAFWSGPLTDPERLLPLDPTTDLPPGTLSLGVQAGALDINDAGIVIGGSVEFFDDGITSYSIRTAVVWQVLVDSEGVVTVDGPRPLLPLNGHVESHAGPGSLNELIGGFAQVAGYSSDPREAVVWTVGLNPDGTLTLPSSPISLSPSQSRGNGINICGDVCGRWDKRPFLALAGQDPQTLPVPRNTQNGYAEDVNDLGEIVGFLDIQKKPRGGTLFPAQWHAYLWRGDQMIDLGKQIVLNSGWDKLEWATTINNAGVIGGWGRFDVQHRGFIMIPNE